MGRTQPVHTTDFTSAIVTVLTVLGKRFVKGELCDLLNLTVIPESLLPDSSSLSSETVSNLQPVRCPQFSDICLSSTFRDVVCLLVTPEKTNSSWRFRDHRSGLMKNILFVWSQNGHLIRCFASNWTCAGARGYLQCNGIRF